MRTSEAKRPERKMRSFGSEVARNAAAARRPSWAQLQQRVGVRASRAAFRGPKLSRGVM